MLICAFSRLVSRPFYNPPRAAQSDGKNENPLTPVGDRRVLLVRRAQHRGAWSRELDLRPFREILSGRCESDVSVAFATRLIETQMRHQPKIRSRLFPRVRSRTARGQSKWRK